MPIDTSRMLLPLSPLAPLNIGGLGGGSLERQQLQLMRQKFEEQKRQNRLDNEYRNLTQANEMAKAQLTAENDRRKAEEAAAAERLKTRQAAELKFAEMAGAGDAEGMRAFVPYMHSVGKGAELLGEEGGMPAFRLFNLDKDGNEIPEGPEGIGYPGDDTGRMDTQPGIGSTEEAFRKAQAASAFAEETGQPLRAPDSPDFTGGVPKNVIDLGAMQASTMQRLAPALGSLVQAYPGQYQQSAMETARGVAGMGLPGIKALEQFKSLRGSPDSLISSQMEAEAQQGRFEQTQKVAADKEANDRYMQGFKVLGNEIAEMHGVTKDLPMAQEQTQRAIDLLMDDKDSNDTLVYSLISRRMGERGATTEGDIRRVTGMEAMAWLDQLKSWLERGVEGGLPLQQRNAIIDVLKGMQESDGSRYERYQNAIQETIDDPSTDRDTARGLREYRKISVPKKYRETWEGARKGQSSGNFDQELDAQSRASGLDPNKVRGVIRPESGGDPGAVNPKSGASGLIQFLPKVAESLGTTIEEVRNMTAEQQIPLVMKYLSERGITKDSTPGDYYMAVAAPAFIGKPDSAVVYAKGSKEWEQNPAWRPSDGGDITVGDIKRYGAGGKKTEAPKNDKANRIEELLRKGGY